MKKTMKTKEELLKQIQYYAKNYNFMPLRKSIDMMHEISNDIDEIYKKAEGATNDQNRGNQNSSNY